jgi:hypothetical protein
MTRTCNDGENLQIFPVWLRENRDWVLLLEQRHVRQERAAEISNSCDGARWFVPAGDNVVSAVPKKKSNPKSQAPKIFASKKPVPLKDWLRGKESAEPVSYTTNEEAGDGGDVRGQ